MSDMFLIRTDGGYWRPNAAGYTTDIRDAGRYTREDAEAHIKGLGPEKMARIIQAPNDKLTLTVVRERKGGGIRCVYLGHLRIAGAKPYVSENLPYKQWDVPLSDLDDILRFARAVPPDARVDFQQPNGPTEAEGS